MKMTSAAVNKRLRALEEEKQYLLNNEGDTWKYTLAEGEKEAAPKYDYSGTQEKIDDIDRQVRRLKHSLNVFNVTTVLEGMGVTIDEALVEMAQLNKKKEKLDRMRKQQPKTRVSNGFRNTNLIEYEYVNYDIAEAYKDYQQVCERIIALQMALDLCNQTIAFEVEE